MRIGELFAGYGGLGMGVQAAMGGDIAWVSEIDPGACKILRHRFPDVPNIGDITTADWSQVEPVDVLTGGSPCQDLSHAGKRQGMTPGTRSNLWVAMREAIAQLKPGLVIWENVRGAYSAEADSALEFCPGCMGDGRLGVVLRALGRVLGDFSDLGYDAQWHGLRAADIGAPHGRFRVFVLAWRRDAAADAGSGGRLGDSHLLGDGWSQAKRGEARDHVGDSRTSSARMTLLSTPQSRDYKGVPGDGFNQANLARDVSLLPTPAVNDMGEGKTVEAWDEWTATMQAKHGNGNGHGKSLAIEAQRLLPTPTSMDSHASGGGYNGQNNVTLTDATVRQADRWGTYAPAIARWEALTRPAPEPTQPSKKGTPQLSPAFSEWMMGLPRGWVTDVPGITRSEALKALGNGVVPQQAAAALRVMLGREATRVA